MAFLKTIQIVLVLVTGILSEETSSSGLAGQELSQCNIPEAPEDGMPLRLENAAVDDTGEKCYQPISDVRYKALFTKTLLEEAFANATAETCPGWSNSKKCLSRHLTTRCSSEEKKLFQESLIFNNYIIMTELLCEPPENFNLLNLFKQGAVDDGLADCYTLDADIDAVMCMERFTNKEDFFLIPFQQAIPLLLECSIEPIKDCSKGNVLKELRLLNLWTQVTNRWISSHSAIWNQLNPPKSTILNLLT